MASVAGHAGRPNEDFLGALPTAVVLLDGAGIPGTESICRHGVAWYATRLGGTLLSLLSRLPEKRLRTLLAEAIEQVTDTHRETCDVTNPISPSATVAILRLSRNIVEYLVLGDTFAVLDRAGSTPLVVTDAREVTIARQYEEALKGGAEHQRVLQELRARRNRAGGFWLAKDDPGAADEAITGAHTVAELTGAALLSNGAGRIVNRFRLTDWPGVMVMLAASGPADLIERVRRAELSQGVPADDATVAYLTTARA
jgi:hypothetical protein